MVETITAESASKSRSSVQGRRVEQIHQPSRSCTHGTKPSEAGSAAALQSSSSGTGMSCVGLGNI